jgi:acyl-CoA hydrolase
MTWMDEIAAVCARRYAKGPVTTACVEKLRFLRPAYCNETLVITGRVIYTGKTSMEVLVNAEIERFSKERELIADSHVILVALDDDEKPRAVPKLIPETEQEKAWYEEAKARREREK